MALDYVSFINILGEEVSVENLVNQMIDIFYQKHEIGETKITDFNEGSEIRNILEAISVLAFNVLEDENEAGKLPFITTSEGTYLDRIGENPFINLPRIEGSPSEGNVTFSLGFEQDTDYTIPVETVVETEEGLMFRTNDVCIIEAGETSASVGAVCMTSGYDGNVASGMITVIADDTIDSELVSVTNEEEFYNGTDYEEDEDYRLRLLGNTKQEGFGSIPYYTALGESVDGVHDVALVNASGYTKKVLVNSYSKPCPDDIFLEVLAKYTDTNNIVLNHNFTADKASLYPNSTGLALTITLSVLSELSTTDLTNFVTKMVYGGNFNQIEFEGLGIGEDLTKQLFVNNFALLDDVVEVSSVVITGQSSEFDSTSVSNSEVVKLGTLTFVQNVVTG